MLVVDEVVEDGGVVVVVAGRVVVGGGRVVLVVVVEVVVAGVALSAQTKMRPFSRSALATSASASAVCAARSRQGGHIARTTGSRAVRVKRILPPMILDDFRDQHCDEAIGVIPLGLANELQKRSGNPPVLRIQ